MNARKVNSNNVETPKLGRPYVDWDIGASLTMEVTLREG
jgi:hypothetical protein